MRQKKPSSESRDKILIKIRISELNKTLQPSKRERLRKLSRKYALQLEQINALGCELVRVNETFAQFSEMISEVPPTLIIPRKEVIVDAILGDFISQYDFLNDCYALLKERYENAEQKLREFTILIPESRTCMLYTEAMDAAEDKINGLHKLMKLVHEKTSEFYELCHRFICVCENTLKKIKFVLERN